MSKAEILAYNRGRADGVTDTEITNRQAMAMAAEALLLDLLSVHRGEHVCTKSIDGATCPSEYVYNLIGDAVYERLTEINANIATATSSGGPTE